MIDTKSRIINQLLPCIYIDKKDTSVLRVDIENAIKILTTFGYNLPRNIYESKLEDILNKKIVGQAKVSTGAKYAIADIILLIADKMHVDESAIIKYITEHNTEEDVKEIQNKIKNWRKEYYGSMDKSTKNALLETLQDKLRADVLDEIRRA